MSAQIGDIDNVAPGERVGGGYRKAKAAFGEHDRVERSACHDQADAEGSDRLELASSVMVGGW